MAGREFLLLTSRAFKEGKYSAAHLEELEQQLTGDAAELWYTETGAYYCKKGEDRSSLQDADAQRLNHLITTKHPAHVFCPIFVPPLPLRERGWG